MSRRVSRCRSTSIWPNCAGQAVGLLEHLAQRLGAEHQVPADALLALGELGDLAAEVHGEPHVVVGLAHRRLEGAGLVGGGDPARRSRRRRCARRRGCRSRRPRRACARRRRSAGWRRRRGSVVPSSSTLRTKAFLSISPSRPKAPSATFSSRRSATSSAAVSIGGDLLGEVGELARELRPLLEGRLLGGLRALEEAPPGDARERDLGLEAHGAAPCSGARRGAEQARLARQQRAQRLHRLVEAPLPPPPRWRRRGGRGCRGRWKTWESCSMPRRSWRRASSGSASPASTSWAM